MHFSVIVHKLFKPLINLLMKKTTVHENHLDDTLMKPYTPFLGIKCEVCSCTAHTHLYTHCINVWLNPRFPANEKYNFSPFVCKSFTSRLSLAVFYSAAGLGAKSFDFTRAKPTKWPSQACDAPSKGMQSKRQKDAKKRVMRERKCVTERRMSGGCNKRKRTGFDEPGRLLKRGQQLVHGQLAALEHTPCSRLASATSLLYGLFVPAEVAAQWELYAQTSLLWISLVNRCASGKRYSLQRFNSRTHQPLRTQLHHRIRSAAEVEKTRCLCTRLEKCNIRKGSTDTNSSLYVYVENDH